MSVNVDISGYDVDAVCGVLTNIGFFVSGDKTKQPNAILFGGDFNCGLIFSNSKKTSLLDFLIKDVFLETIVSAVAKQLELSLNQLSLEIGFSKNYLSRAINNNNLTLDTERKIFEKLLNLLKLDASGGLGLVEHDIAYADNKQRLHQFTVVRENQGLVLDDVELIDRGELNNLRSANAELETINDEYVDIITHQEKERGELIKDFDSAISSMVEAINNVVKTLRETTGERDGLKEQLRKTQIIAFILLVACACLGLALGVMK